VCVFSHRQDRETEQVSIDAAILGWKSMTLTSDGKVKSLHRQSYWTPHAPQKASGKPSTASGRGIYAYMERPSRYGLIVKVNLWGKVLKFEGGSTFGNGYMAEFAEILEIHVKYVGFEASHRKYAMQRMLKDWEGSGVKIYQGRKLLQK
jgi:hypothetical protein